MPGDASRDGLAPPAQPAPLRLYVHDDLTGEVRERHGAGSAALSLALELMTLVRRDAERVTVVTVDDQIERLLARGTHAPFALAIGIGRAGERVARQLHAHTGWFPALRRVDVTREEDGRGGYVLVTTTGTPLAAQLAGVEDAPSLALVDDTIFSGLTLRTVLEALPAAVRARTRAFCLRCVAETLPSIEALCPVTPGLAAHGRILEEVSLINASGLVRRGAIRRAGRPPLAFFERPEWIRAWFPHDAVAIIDCCRRLAQTLGTDPPPGG
jgi:pyrimidine operon attenuation protein/uracil phosphoribosyltransferase